MREIVRAWLSTELTEDRHRKRVGKIEAIERQYNGRRPYDRESVSRTVAIGRKPLKRLSCRYRSRY